MMHTNVRLTEIVAVTLEALTIVIVTGVVVVIAIVPAVHGVLVTVQVIVYVQQQA